MLFHSWIIYTCNKLIVQRATLFSVLTRNYFLQMCNLPKDSFSEWWFTFISWAFIPSMHFLYSLAFLWEIQPSDLLGFYFHFWVLSKYSIHKIKVTYLIALSKYGKRKVLKSISNNVHPVLISFGDRLTYRVRSNPECVAFKSNKDERQQERGHGSSKIILITEWIMDH